MAAALLRCEGRDLYIDLEDAGARRVQVGQFVVVVERAAAVNDEVRVPFAGGEGRRVPGAAVVGVGQTALDAEGDDLVHVRRLAPVRGGDADDGLRAGERRGDLHRVRVARHEIEDGGARL